MSKAELRRNFIIIVRSQELWDSFLNIVPDFRSALKDDTQLEHYTDVLPSDVEVQAPAVVRRLSFHNQRTLQAVYKKIRHITTFCTPDPRDFRFKASLQSRSIDHKNEIRCYDCSRLLLAHKINQDCDRRQDLTSYETLDKKVKLESTKIES